MQSPSSPFEHLRFDSRLTAALSLTFVGGFVDAVGFIALMQVFTANMSGNSIHLGIYAAQWSVASLWRYGCAINAYVLGLVITRSAIELASRRGIQRIATATLGAEAVLLLIFSALTPKLHFGQVTNLHSLPYYGMVALLSFTMGLQTATLTHSGPLTVYTTFVTGTLTKFAESITRALFWIIDELRSGLAPGEVLRQGCVQEDLVHSAFLVVVWVSYVGGAVVGILAKRRWEFHSFLLPVAILLCLILLDRKQPISAQDEQEQVGQSSRAAVKPRPAA